MLHDWPREPFLVKLNGKSCVELDPRNGALKKTFTLGPIESPELAQEPIKRFGGPKDATSGFWAGRCLYEPLHGWLACGSAFDRRMRVLGASAPDKIMFETYTDANPFRPWGGNWTATPIGC